MGFEQDFAHRDQLIEAAIAELDTHGYAKASLNRILTAAGMSKGQFYHHFETKEALYLALVALMIERKREHFARNPIEPNGDLFDIVRAQLRAGSITLQDKVGEALARFRSCVGKRFVTSYLVLCRCRGSRGARDLGGGLGDRGLLLVKRPARGRDVGAGSGDLGLRLFDIGAVVTRIEDGEQLAAADGLVVGDEDTLDIAADLR